MRGMWTRNRELEHIYEETRNKELEHMYEEHG
jgi:hypothetical protein